MAIVFKTPLNTKNLTTNDSQNIDSPIGCNLEAGSVEYNENGEYTLEPESADGFSSVEITVDVPSNVNNQEKSVTISANGTSTITYDANYTGLSSVGITVDVEPDLEAKTVEYTANNTYTIAPSSGKDGISSATVTVNVDTVTPYNEGKAAGIAEQKAKLESATFVSNGTYTKEDGYNSVTVAVPSDINNQNKTATPSTSAQEITADSGYSGLGKVTISAVTAAIDSDIVAGNIKKDVEILGVTGTYDPQPELQDKTVTPSTSQQVISADSGYDGLDEVTVNAVTSSIDANIAAGNIKDGVTILGVTGNYTGGGGGCLDSIGYTCNDIGILFNPTDVAYTETVKDNGRWYADTTLVLAPKTSNSSQDYLFQQCTSLKFVPNFTLTSSTPSYNGLFSSCSNLKNVGDISIPNATGYVPASGMFSGCISLESIGNIDLSKTTNAGTMFFNSGIKQAFVDNYINNLDFSKVEDFTRAFASSSGTANKYTTAPSIDMSSAVNVTGVFNAGSRSNHHITTVPQYNWSKVENIEGAFNYQTDLTTIAGFINLGKAFKSTDSSIYHILNFTTTNTNDFKNITKQSIMNIINNVAAPDDTACNNATIKLNATVYGLLDASDIAIATAKNWSVISA